MPCQQCTDQIMAHISGQPETIIAPKHPSSPYLSPAGSPGVHAPIGSPPPRAALLLLAPPQPPEPWPAHAPPAAGVPQRAGPSCLPPAATLPAAPTARMVDISDKQKWNRAPPARVHVCLAFARQWNSPAVYSSCWTLAATPPAAHCVHGGLISKVKLKVHPARARVPFSKRVCPPAGSSCWPPPATPPAAPTARITEQSQTY